LAKTGQARERTLSALIENAIELQNGWMVRGYSLTEFLGYEAATLVYHAQTEELWLPPEITIRLFHLPDTFSAQEKAYFMSNFNDEAQRMIQLRHKALFPLFGYGEQEDMAYLLMPSIPGETLATQMKHRDPWTPQEALDLIRPLGDAIDTIHSHGLTHQFLYPAQILMTSEQRPQIMCLRLAQMVCLHNLHPSSQPITHLQALDGTYLGEPEYLAPEVVRGDQPDPRSDIYSLGVLLFELLSGQTPYSGDNYLTTARKHLFEVPLALRELIPDIPAQLEIVINRALHPNPQYRFQTSKDFVTACTQALQEHKRPSYTSLLDALRLQKQSLPEVANANYAMSMAYLTAKDEAQILLEDDVPPSSPEDQEADAWLNTSHAPAAPVRAPISQQTDPIPKQYIDKAIPINPAKRERVRKQQYDAHAQAEHPAHTQPGSHSRRDTTSYEASSLY
jgi:serine/threonine protein kinase